MIDYKLMVLAAAVAVGFMASSVRAEWAPVGGGLMTRWAGQVSPSKVHPEHPRPQMVRPTWQNLNGL
jgi:hypothetical protein